DGARRLRRTSRVRPRDCAELGSEDPFHRNRLHARCVLPSASRAPMKRHCTPAGSLLRCVAHAQSGAGHAGGPDTGKETTALTVVHCAASYAQALAAPSVGAKLALSL